jgi:hypothetical protein
MSFGLTLLLAMGVPSGDSLVKPCWTISWPRTRPYLPKADRRRSNAEAEDGGVAMPNGEGDNDVDDDAVILQQSP